MSNRGLGFTIPALVILCWTSCGTLTPPLEPGYKVAAKWDGAGTGAQKLEEPQGIAVSNEGEVFVADARACRVKVFSPAGQLLRSFGECGSKPGQLQKPLDIAIGPEGNVYVADFELDRVQAFTPEG